MTKNHLQRLLAPPGNEAFSGIGTFAGLTKEIKKELFKIAAFDYMENSEYEFGSIPKSLQQLCFQKEKLYIQEVIAGTTFHFIIDSSKKEEYLGKLKIWVKDNYDRGDEYHGLKDIVSGKNDSKIVGWLDIDEHVMFFCDTEEGRLMAKQFQLSFTPE